MYNLDCHCNPGAPLSLTQLHIHSNNYVLLLRALTMAVLWEQRDLCETCQRKYYNNHSCLMSFTLCAFPGHYKWMLANVTLHHSPSELDAPSPSLPPLPGRDLDVPAPSWTHAFPVAPNAPLGVSLSPPRAAPHEPRKPHVSPCREPGTIPLHHARTSMSMASLDVSYATRIVLTCIDMCMAIVTMHIASMDASKAHSAHRNKIERGRRGGCC